MDETFSSIDLVTQCLLDTERTKGFQKAIEKVVKPGDFVLDAGTGSGIMSLFAARAGAKKVYSIEVDPYVAKLASQNISNNGYKNVIKVYLKDVRNIILKNKNTFDVVIMEMLTTGMVDEYQVWSINSLFQKGYVNEKTTFIPSKQETFITLAQTNFLDYGFNMRIVKHFWKFLPKSKINFLSKNSILNSVSFNRINEVRFKDKLVFDVTKAGVLNSIYLSSKTWLKEGLELGDTLALNAPVVVPLKKDIEVKKGDKISLTVDYHFGNGYRNFNVKTVKL